MIENMNKLQFRIDKKSLFCCLFVFFCFLNTNTNI